jgi:molecular chaperone DnaK
LVCPALGTRLLRPEEVSAHVVREMLAIAGRTLGAPPTRAVITVPAYFNDAQRCARGRHPLPCVLCRVVSRRCDACMYTSSRTRRPSPQTSLCDDLTFRTATEAAGLAAGLTRVKLLREPVAAALAYGVGREEDVTVLVVDLGGGTFDVSLLDVGGGVVEVLATSGDAHLGGDDFDDAVARWLAGRAGAGVSPKRLQAAGRALREALTGKEALTARFAPGEGGTARLTRAALEALCEPLLSRLRRPIEQASWAAGIDLQAAREDAAVDEAAAAAPPARSRGGGKRGRRAAERASAPATKVSSRQRPGAAFALGRAIDEVILVGGATRMPAVQRLVSAMTARPVQLGSVDPDEAVALGAALQAGALEGTVRDAETIEVWQAALMRALVRKQAQDAQQAADGAEAGSSSSREEEGQEGQEGEEGEEGEDGEDGEDGDADDDAAVAMAAEEDAFEHDVLLDPAQRVAQPSRLPSADEMEERVHVLRRTASSAHRNSPACARWLAHAPVPSAQDMLMYEASVSGDSAPLDGVADKAARFAARFRASSADVSEDVDEYEGMDLEEIAAMGLSAGALGS